MKRQPKDRKSQILNASARLFRRRGFAATSMRDIAKELQIEAPSLYNHISSKQDLLKSLIMGVAHQYVDDINKVQEREDLSPVDKLRLIINGHIEISYHNINAVSLIPTEYVHLDGNDSDEFRLLRDHYDRTFKTVISDGVADLSIKPVDIDLTGFSILSSLRFLYSWIRKNRDMELREIQEDLVESLIGGIASSAF